MYYLAEDPWPILYVLGGLAVVCLIALRVTQQGKFLIGAGLALALALAFFGIERVWVTDNERIEEVVYGLARAVAAADGEKAADYLAPEAIVELGGPEPTSLFGRGVFRFIGRFMGHRLTREELRDSLKDLKFDYLRITRLETNAGAMTRLGRADFVAHAMGEVHAPTFLTFATPANGSAWSLGFREVEPGVWKITRISPVFRPAVESR
jgi:hypothetical protein